MLAIGGVLVSPPLLLAPMEDVTDRSFRRLVRAIGGCGLMTTEFVPARGVAEGHKKILRSIDLTDDEHPICVQLFGRDPTLLGEAARVAQDLGADVVDLNMGCPSKRVCASSGGSALMREPALVREIIRQMRAAITVPLTVKMRSGWDARERNAPELARICVGEGAEAITVHWRTRADKYGGIRDLSIIRAVREAVSVPVIANGDVIDGPSAIQTLADTGCAGLMIGRGAVRDPWVFQQVARALDGLPPMVVDARERERVLLTYFEDIRARFRTDLGALGRFKKIANYFTAGISGGGVLRTAVLRSQSPDEAVAHIRRFFSDA